MVELKICTKNKCIEGGIAPDGTVISFDKGKKTCDYCMSYRGTENKVAHSNYPAPDKAIYAIFRDEKLLYIGESKKTSFRLFQHLNGHKNRTNFDSFTKEELDKLSYKILWDGTNNSKSDRLMLEAVLIQSLRPEMNKQWQQED